jgi:hypothetical protein
MRTLDRPVRRRVRALFNLVIIAIALGATALMAFRPVNGPSFGLRSFAKDQVRFARELLDSSHVRAGSRGEYTNILFLHQSVGDNLVEQGGVRERLSQAGYQFWDHSQNWQWLRDPAGQLTSYSYRMPDDKTTLDDYARIFQQKVYNLPWYSFSAALQHQVIVPGRCGPGARPGHVAEVG